LNRKTDYLHASVEKYLEDLSSRRSVPGGGSASALSAALGASLNLMVIEYSMKKAGSSAEDKEFVVLKTKQKESMAKLSEYIDEDCEAFGELIKAHSSGEDLQDKYKRAATVPMGICRQCCASLEVTTVMLGNYNKMLATDVGGAAFLLESAFFSAELNVAVNLDHIEDGKFVQSFRDELASMKEEIKGMMGEIKGNLGRG